KLLLFVQLSSSGEWIVLSPEGRGYTFDLSGNCLSINDHFSNRINFSWDNHYLLKVSAPSEGWFVTLNYRPTDNTNALPMSRNGQLLIFDRLLQNAVINFESHKKNIIFQYSGNYLQKISYENAKYPLWQGEYGDIKEEEQQLKLEVQQGKTPYFHDSLDKLEWAEENKEDMVQWVDLNNDGRTDRITFYTKEYFEQIKKNNPGYTYDLNVKRFVPDMSTEEILKKIKDIKLRSMVEMAVPDDNGKVYWEPSNKLSISSLDIMPFQVIIKQVIENYNNNYVLIYKLELVTNRLEFVDLNNDGLKDLVFCPGLAAIEQSSVVKSIAAHFNPSVKTENNPFSFNGEKPQVYFQKADENYKEMILSQISKTTTPIPSRDFLLPNMSHWENADVPLKCHQQSLFFDANHDGFVDVLTGDTLYLNVGNSKDFKEKKVDPFSLFERGEAATGGEQFTLFDANGDGRPEIYSGDKVVFFPISGKSYIIKDGGAKPITKSSDRQLLTGILSPYGGRIALNYHYHGRKWVLNNIKHLPREKQAPGKERAFQYLSTLIDPTDGTFIGFSKTVETIAQNNTNIPPQTVTKQFSRDTDKMVIYLSSRQRLNGLPLKTVLADQEGTKTKVVTKTTWGLKDLGNRRFFPYIQQESVEEIDPDGLIYLSQTTFNSLQYNEANHYMASTTQRHEGHGIHSKSSTALLEEGHSEKTAYTFLPEFYLVLPYYQSQEDLIFKNSKKEKFISINKEKGVPEFSTIRESVDDARNLKEYYQFDHFGRLTQLRNSRGQSQSS
ncbi:MAG: VCBS repeat-containing protein, partial [Pseudomonadota bacterium]